MFDTYRREVFMFWVFFLPVLCDFHPRSFCQACFRWSSVDAQSTCARVSCVLDIAGLVKGADENTVSFESNSAHWERMEGFVNI